MFALFRRIFTISLAVNLVNVAPAGAEPPIDEDLPFILIKFKSGLEPPKEVKIRGSGFLGTTESIDFGYTKVNKQNFYCPAETGDQRKRINKANDIFHSGNDKIGDEISQSCLFKKDKIEKGSNFPQCEEPFQPTMMKDLIIRDAGKWKKRLVGKPVLCGPRGSGQRLKFGYEICQKYGKWDAFKNKLNIIEKKYPFELTAVSIYKVCYNAEKKRILYTLHQIKTPLLLEDDLLKLEVVKKPKEMATYALNNMSKMDFKQIELTMIKLQNSNTRPKFSIQLLIPLEDFPFLTWKLPVYHFVNASLINTELKRCWKEIHDKIRNDVIKTKRILSIYTRAFEYYEQLSEKNEMDENQIPSIWMKLVHDLRYIPEERSAVAIIANNIRDYRLGEQIWTKYDCEQNLCQRYIDNFFSDGSKDIRCCEVNEQIQSTFGLNLTFKGILDIAGLIDPEAVSSRKKSATKAPSPLLQIGN